VDWVVRGGLATPNMLIAGSREHAAVPGLYGFSVQYEPGRTIEELAQAGRIKNAQISVAPADALQAALLALGYQMQLVRSPGHGFHHTFVVLYDASGTMVQTLPRDAAEAISDSCQRQPNPNRSP
jgi:hypothetical protein